MDHFVTLTPSAAVAPGQQAAMTLTVRNVGAIVERYDIRVLGDAAEWAQPPQPIVVYPGQEQHAVLTFTVPERAVAGEVPVGVLVSAQSAGTSVTKETALVVPPTFGLDTALVPMLSHGRRHGDHTFAVMNRGNTAVTARCEGSGDDVEVSLARREVAVDPFGQTEVPVRVVHQRRQWLRKAGPSAFTVVATTEGGTAAATGSHEAASRVPRWAPLAVVALLALLLAGFALRGSQDAKAIAGRAEETAEAAETPISEQAKAINDLAAAQGKPPPLPPGSPGNPGRLGPSEGGGGGSGADGGSGGGGSGAGAGGLVGDPFDRRFEPASGSDEYEVPDGRLLGITDIVFENAGGDQGRLTLARNGTVLLRADLAGFRDQDTHLVTPLRFKAGDKLTVTVSCTAPGSGSPACSSAALVSGVLAED